MLNLSTVQQVWVHHIVHFRARPDCHWKAQVFVWLSGCHAACLTEAVEDRAVCPILDHVHAHSHVMLRHWAVCCSAVLCVFVSCKTAKLCGVRHAPALTKEPRHTTTQSNSMHRCGGWFQLQYHVQRGLWQGAVFCICMERLVRIATLSVQLGWAVGLVPGDACTRSALSRDACLGC